MRLALHKDAEARFKRLGLVALREGCKLLVFGRGVDTDVLGAVFVRKVLKPI
ncbi:MAG: hypothetical protein IPJ61_20250 [Tessaracoccus sp.]|uniref:hypothetical protein n=1 Tax=Tessaracoccus sp. TaxID=1971211 RepID=UPI001EBF0231|nr:hypothetical protein [Tessaracoccus sp.]MBK7823320.1 hypothetical protein [Tessaracoccus sp.]